MGILLNPDRRFISIDIYYVEEIKQHGNSVFHFIHSPSEMNEWKAKGYVLEGDQPQPAGTAQKKPEKMIHRLNTNWTRLTWKEQNTITAHCIKTVSGSDGRTAYEIDGIKLRDLKLKMCLKKWNLIGEQGQHIEVTPEVIDTLDPVVANELLSSFERVTEPSEVDLKG